MALEHTRPTHTGKRFYTDTQVAEIFGLGKSTLARWRVEGNGPPWCKFGAAVRYPEDQLYRWAESQVCSSTSEHYA